MMVDFSSFQEHCYIVALAHTWNSKMSWRVNQIQWEFQDPKLEVPAIYKAYIRPM